MVKTLMISVSGVRGVVGETLTPEIATKFSAAFGEFLGRGPVLVGSDTRTSSEMFRLSVFSGLISTGSEVIDVGICPTPTLQLMVEKLHAGGGIAISGSHNPAEWNALKFVRSDGLFLYPEEGEKVLEIYNQDKIRRARWDHLGRIYKESSAIENHLDRVLKVVNGKKIKSKKLKVVIDAGNGAGALISPELCRRLGCEVVEVNCEPNGIFSRPPEPIRPHLRELSKIVKSRKADIGFAHDADADRLTIVTDKGEILPEDYTLLLVAKFSLRKKTGLVVTNLSTTQALDDVAAEFNSPVKRTKIGDIHVSRCMKEEKATIGGEGNGGVIIPEVHYARDGIAAIALLLEYLADTDESVSELAKKLPRYYMVKGKRAFTGKDFSRIKNKLEEEFKPESLDFLDGVKITLEDGWIHIRPSGTEPVIRIITEAKTKERAEALYQLGLEKINEAA
ncbi:MAG: phosphoglucosamine mutase [bacterium]